MQPEDEVTPECIKSLKQAFRNDFLHQKWVNESQREKMSVNLYFMWTFTSI